MGFFIGIACPWLLIAVLMMMADRRAEDPTAGQWRSQPSRFFGGPDSAPDQPAIATAPTSAA